MGEDQEKEAQNLLTELVLDYQDRKSIKITRRY